MGRHKKIKDIKETNDKSSGSSKNTERDTALQNMMRDINKKLGPNAIKFAKDEPIKTRIPFGVEAIDNFTGGAVRGNFVIAYGGDSVGKSTLAYTQIATCQKAGLRCAYFDLEHSMNPKRAESFGVNLGELILIEEITTAEQAMDILINLAKAKVIDYAVIDSIQAMSPKGQQETKKGEVKSVEDDNIALLARKMSQFLTMSKDYVYAANIGVLLIGQIRTGGIGTFVITSTLTGGNALKHYSMLTLFMRKGQGADAPVEKYKEYFEDQKGKVHHITKERAIGHDLVISIEKTKVDNCRPERSQLHLPFYFNTGFFAPKKEEVEKEVTDASSKEETKE